MTITREELEARIAHAVANFFEELTAKPSEPPSPVKTRGQVVAEEVVRIRYGPNSATVVFGSDGFKSLFNTNDSGEADRYATHLRMYLARVIDAEIERAKGEAK